MSIAIRASELSKNYRIYRRPVDRFIELFVPGKRHTVFPALQDVTFEIEKGETIGLVGQNGAGKSTLLKLLCRVAEPTSGSLHSEGTIASILELGTGFHPEFSGRDNASLNASILGLTSAEVKQKLPAMLEFSELGSFLDRPVKTYSSGMYMRLAFSVAVNADPDILVIDEALAVGDGHFQKKCIDKIRDFQSRGKTILFCSHALYYISTLCHRTIWLDQGTVRRIGTSVDVVHDYETFLLEQDKRIAAEEGVAEPVTERRPPVRISEMRIESANGEPKEVFETGDDIYLRLRIESENAATPLHVLVGVNRAADETQCFSFGTTTDDLPPLSGQRTYEIVTRLHQVPLLRGDYAIAAFIGDESAMHVYDRKDLRPAFSMGGDRFEIGMIKVEHTWNFDASSMRLAATR
jgi:ABC-type polysaccharide/polyol phosphate transport system ATPase subunit